MAKKKEHGEAKVSEEAKESKKSKFNFSKLNYWMVAAVLLAIVLLVFVSVDSFSSISKKKAGETVTNFLVSAYGVTASDVNITSVSSKDDFYFVNFSVQSQSGSFTVSKDGSYVGQMISIVSLKAPAASTSTTIAKSDKPVFEAFVSPYCPYGLQYMKGLIPVYGLLKNKADIKIRLLSPTHIAEEQPQIVKELCIQDVYGEDLYFEFLRNVVCDSVASECYNVYHGVNLQTGASMPASANTKNGTYFTNCMAKVNDAAGVKAKINKANITSCVSSKGNALYQAALKYNENYDVGGSPSPFIGGVALPKDLSGRSPNDIKNAICSAYNTAPSECSTALSTTTYSPGIGISTQKEGSVPSSVCG